MKKSQKKKMQRLLKNSLYMLGILLLVFGITRFIGEKTIVEGSSMEPSLSDGDYLITEKLSYKFGDPKRFDIIVFPYRHNSSQYIVKRVIALPGERVAIKDGVVFINDEELTDIYGKGTLAADKSLERGLLLGADEYFVLGDNREESIDSRNEEIGAVKREFIMGRVCFRMLPADKMGKVK